MTPLLCRLAPVLGVTLLALALPSAASAACPANTVCEDVYFPSADGTQLHGDLIRPKGSEGKKLPVIVSSGPYFAHSGQTGAVGEDFSVENSGPNDRFKDLWDAGKIFEKGYAWLGVDLRGFGASAGCNDFGGKGEQADAKAAVEYAANAPWSTGSVGTWGKSYDGWTQVMAMNGKPKGLKAAVIQAPIIDGYRTLYQNGVHYDAGWYATPGLYQSIDAAPPTLNDDPGYIAGFATGTNPACYSANIVQQNATIEWDDPFWQERNLNAARGSDVAVLWSHGFLDANTKPDNFLPVWKTLKGPKRAWFGQFTHVRPSDKAANGRDSTTGREGWFEESMRFLDRYVKGVPAAEAPVENDPVVEVEDGATMKYRAEAAWPPADVKLHALALEPGSVALEAGNSGETGPGDGKWSTTAPLPHDVHMAGEPIFKGAVSGTTPRTNLHVILYDISEKGMAKLVSRGAYAVKSSGPLSFDLYPQDWTFKAGHRIGVLVAPSDEGWYLAPNQAGSVSWTAAAVQIPALRHLRDTFLKSKPSEDERARGAGFDVSSKIGSKSTVFDLPAKMVPAPAVTLAGTPAAGGKPKRKLTVVLRGTGRSLVATGVAPAGTKLTVTLLRNGKKAGTKRTTAPAQGRYTVRFKVKRKGTYRAQVTIKEAGATVKVRSRTRKVKR